jgi:hypothetical protein
VNPMDLIKEEINLVIRKIRLMKNCMIKLIYKIQKMFIVELIYY